MEEYDKWLEDPTPESMAGVIGALEPTINSEVHRYAGPKPLLRSKAKSLAVQAVKKYDPTQGAQLKSWVVTQMQPLRRYNQQLRPVQAPEMSIRQAAEVNRLKTQLSDELGRDPTVDELADETGISVKRINHIQRQVLPTVTESMTENVDAEGVSSGPGVVQPDYVGEAEDVIYESLAARDQMVYDWKIGRHGKPMLSNQEIAKRLGVTPALVSQRSAAIAEQISDYANKRMRGK